MPPNAAASARQAASMAKRFTRGAGALSEGGAGGSGALSLSDGLNSTISGAICGASMLSRSIFGATMDVILSAPIGNASMADPALGGLSTGGTIMVANAIFGTIS